MKTQLDTEIALIDTPASIARLTSQIQNSKSKIQNSMKTHTQTATVREMRTLANTCKTQAADAAECRKLCLELSKTTCDNAERADRSAGLAEEAQNRAFYEKTSAELAAGRADRRAHDAQAAANIAADAARDARKTSRAIIIALLIAILADAALYFFTH